MFKFSKLTINKVMNPLIDDILKQYRKGKTTIIGFQAGMGLGKSTWVKHIKQDLRSKGYKVESFSIDDFYQTNNERLKFSNKHPNNEFYQISRGMPGTHRLKLLKETLKKIKHGKPFQIPSFDKSKHQGRGDVLKEVVKVKGRQDFVLFEGWCVGVPLVSLNEFKKISKKHKFNLKRIDSSGESSKLLLKFVKSYQPLWKYLDYIIMMKPESNRLILKWRNDQERELKQEKGEGMSLKEIVRFVNVYLPLTYVCYDKIKPNVVLKSNKKHEFDKIKFMKINS
jgi:D-glycerate 3-kinase